MRYADTHEEQTYNEGIELYPISVEPPEVAWVETQETQTDRIPLEDALKRPGRLNEWLRDAALPAFPTKIRELITPLTLRGDRVIVRPTPQFLHFDLPGEKWTPTAQGLFVVGGDSNTRVLRPFKWSRSMALLKTTLLNSPQQFEAYEAPPLTFIWSPRGPFAHGRGTAKNLAARRYAYDFAKVYS